MRRRLTLGLSLCGVGTDEQRLSCNFVVLEADSSSINRLCRSVTAAAAVVDNDMRNTRSRKSHHSGKENGTASLPSTSSASSSKGKEKAGSVRNVRAKKEKEELLFCSCRGIDDGTPMVQCGNCDEWLVLSSSSTPLSYSRPS